MRSEKDLQATQGHLMCIPQQNVDLDVAWEKKNVTMATCSHLMAAAARV